MHWQRARRLPKNLQLRSRAERAIRNRRQKLQLAGEHRRRGIASAALKAALAAIKPNGGALVEAYRFESWLSRVFGNESTPEVLSIFEKEGFKVVAPFGTTKSALAF